MRRLLTTKVIAVAAAALFALAGAISTAEAGRGGHGGGGRGGHMSGGHMSGSHSFKGGSHSFKGGSAHYKGGGKGYGYGGKGRSKHYAHGGNWDGKYNSHRRGKYSHYRRYGYPWYGVYAYGGSGCGWLYSRALATGSNYWWSRYYQCVGY